MGEDLARIRVARLLRNTASHLGKRRDGGESILREFPKPIKIGQKAVAWSAREIAEWQKAQIAKREA